MRVVGDGRGHMEATCSTAIPTCTRIQCNLRVKRPQFQAELLLPAGAHTLFGLINSGANDNIIDEDLALQLSLTQRGHWQRLGLSLRNILYYIVYYIL